VAATVVLVHGAWHGAWCWGKVLPLLYARDVRWVAVDLPGHGTNHDPLTDLAGDAAFLHATLDELDRDAIVCGHSYGGAVVTEGAAHPRASHLVYLTAFQLEPGESCANAVADDVSPEDGRTELGDAIRRGDDGITTLDPDMAGRIFYNDCADHEVAWALERIGPHRIDALTQPATRAAWHDRPSTYAVCTGDRAVTPAVQRALSRRADDVVEWPTGHSPFVSRPELVADLLAALATRD
jgi:pimeloyl-ACP methyl ester carboxylesterase